MGTVNTIRMGQTEGIAQDGQEFTTSHWKNDMMWTVPVEGDMGTDRLGRKEWNNRWFSQERALIKAAMLKQMDKNQKDS